MTGGVFKPRRFLYFLRAEDEQGNVRVVADFGDGAAVKQVAQKTGRGWSGQSGRSARLRRLSGFPPADRRAPVVFQQKSPRRVGKNPQMTHFARRRRTGTLIRC